MSYILCKTKRSDIPFYIENISVNIYSIEELCFYLYHNIYLLDETILNERLCFWLRDELGMDVLARRMMQLLDQEASVSAVILPAFKEIHYLSHEEFRMFSVRLNQFEVQPRVTKQKIKGDYLFGHEKYMNAVKVYRNCLSMQGKDITGSQFTGSVYHNMGCAYARLLQMDEAKECFRRAWEYLSTQSVLRSYLTAVYMAGDEEEMDEEAARLGVEDKVLAELKQKIEETRDSLWQTRFGERYAKMLELEKQGRQQEYEEEVDRFLAELTDGYHRNTGF